MSALQQILDDAVAQGDLPFAVGMVATSQGVTFSGAAGHASAGMAASPTTLMRIFSMTKAIGSTAAMVLIDRGKLTFDTPVADIVPEFASLQVLEGFDGDTPRLRAPKRPATVRHLATHTSGLEYEFWNADVAAYVTKAGHPSVLSGTRQSLAYPLMSDPGTRWGYGMGIDWLGLVVERISGRSIVDFCQTELFEPLGMTDTHFVVPADKAHRLADVKIRTADGGFAPMDLAPPANPEVFGMGHALYSTPADYLRFVRMMLGRGALDGRRVLSEAGVTAMLADHMQGLRFAKMISVAPVTDDFDPFPGLDVRHSFGFMRNEVDIPGRRAAGSQAWAGVLNSHYWFDPTRGIGAVLMTQSLPFVEPRYMATYDAFERAVYAA
jgi:methyl acetate hydrolase